MRGCCIIIVIQYWKFKRRYCHWLNKLASSFPSGKRKTNEKSWYFLPYIITYAR